jgi:hypothetical protein
VFKATDKIVSSPFVWILAIIAGISLTIFMVASALAAGDAPKSIFLPLVSTLKENTNSGVSSQRLIEAARSAGTIDDETALLYRIYADFEDPRLPTQFRGDDSLVGASIALHEAQARMDTLSPATQVALASFLVPPSAEESWHEQQSARIQLAGGNAPSVNNAKIKWLTTCNTDPNIKVWYQERYPEDAESARQICEVVAGEIWPRLTSLMGRKPMDDGAEANNGGDAQLDFYLVNARTGSVAYRGCDNTPSYLTVHRTRWNKALLTSAVMGAFLDSYDTADCLEYMWLYAATRTWAIDYVYPQDQWEHHYADDFLLHSDDSLNSYPVIPLDAQNEVGDGAYLWVWFATNMLKSAEETVPFWWQNASNPDSLDAVNSVMGDKGFDTEWKRFSELNWNNEPVDIYKGLDSMPHSTKLMLDEAVTLDGATDRTYEFDANVRYLAAHTYRFTFPDPEVRSVLFYNPFQDGAFPTADVSVYYRLEDQSWHIEEWTAQYGKGFCRDLEAERVEELIIVISNDEWQDRSHKLEPAKPPRLNVTNVACRGWEFEGKATLVGSGPEYSKNDTATVKATFMRQPFGDESGASSIDNFQVVEGTGTWSHSGQWVNCGGSGGGSWEVTGGYHTNLFIFAKATDHSTSSEYVAGDRRYSATTVEGVDKRDQLSVEYTCTSGNSYKLPSESANSWFTTETEPTQEVSDDGKTIKGSYTRTDVSDDLTNVYTWEWTMTALPPE